MKTLRMSTATKKTRSKIAHEILSSGIHGPLLVVAGEHSGDLLGGDVLSHLKKLGLKEFFGTGGETMKREGAEIIQDVESMAVMGFVDALRNYSRLHKLARDLVARAKEKGARYALLIDYPGFNLRIAKMLHAEGIHVIFLVSPQLWAWHYSRIHTIKKYVDLMLVLFEFEKEMYEEAGVRCEFIGHPLIKRIPERLAEEAPVALKRVKTIGLMPGSRPSEIVKLLPAMLDTAKILVRGYPGVRFLLPNINPKMEAYIQEQLAGVPELKVEYLKDRSLRVLEASDAVIVASGTATLETAYFLRPMVILYRTSWINVILASLLMRTRMIGIVNILARRQVALELLQTEVTPENIAREIVRIFEDDGYRRAMVSELEYVKRSLGSGNPAEKAARAIQTFARSTHSAR